MGYSIRCGACGKIPCRYHKIPRRGNSHSSITPNYNVSIALEEQRQILRHDLSDPGSKLWQDGFRLAITL